ncbi:MAG: hypothetical protein AAFU49_02200 [Pseudomonadota bacterium]
MIETLRRTIVRAAFATPLLGAVLRDFRDGPDSSVPWLVFNLLGVTAIALLVGGWAALSLVTLAATAVILLMFFWNT